MTQNPAISLDGKLVAYVSDRGGNMDVWVQQVNGGDPVQLTRDIGICRDPAFSPDGSKIVVTCGVDRGDCLRRADARRLAAADRGR